MFSVKKSQNMPPKKRKQYSNNKLQMSKTRRVSFHPGHDDISVSETEISIENYDGQLGLQGLLHDSVHCDDDVQDLESLLDNSNYSSDCDRLSLTVESDSKSAFEFACQYAAADNTGGGAHHIADEDDRHDRRDDDKSDLFFSESECAEEASDDSDQSDGTSVPIDYDSTSTLDVVEIKHPGDPSLHLSSSKDVPSRNLNSINPTDDSSILTSTEIIDDKTYTTRSTADDNAADNENEVQHNEVPIQGREGIQPIEDLSNDLSFGDNVDELDQQLYDGCSITKRESLLLIMGHIIRYHMSGEALNNLLKIFEFHLPAGTSFPASKFLFNKNFQRSDGVIQFHAYCPDCCAYIGEKDDTCKNCERVVSVNECIDNGEYFIAFDVEEQMCSLLANDTLNKYLQIGEKRQECDLYTGKLYRKIPFGHDDLSLSFNTDGVQVFVSSKYSIWPLQVMISELPYEIRRKNIMLGGLWFGKSKPVMNTFCRPFISTMNRLSTVGFEWSDGVRLHTSRAFSTVCICDSVARCLVQNVSQFNGEYGCNWCVDRGEVVPVGRGHARVYTVGKELAQLRTVDGYIENAREALETNRPQMGVKGPSVLLLLNHFNVVENFVVDYMHAVCLGVVRYVTGLWLDSSSHTEDYYLGTHTDQLDERLEGISPPSEITRFTSTLKMRKNWKASEWRAWLLHYSALVLHGILPTAHYKHWMLLVTSMHFLLSDEITQEMIDLCECLLFDFVVQFQEMYGKQAMKFNVHQLLHLVDSVRNWGPIWAYSAFPFESMNGKLTKLFHGTQCVAQQISNKFILLKGLPSLAAGAFADKVNMQKHFKKNVLGFDGHDCSKRSDSVCHIGLPKNVKLSPAQLNALAAIGVHLPGAEVKAFQKVVTRCGYSLVSSQIQHKSQKRENSCVRYSNGKIGTLELIVSVCPNQCAALLCECQVLYCIINTMHTIRTVFSSETSVYKVKFDSLKEVVAGNSANACLLSEISGKCVVANIKQKTFVSLLPSAKELD